MASEPGLFKHLFCAPTIFFKEVVFGHPCNINFPSGVIGKRLVSPSRDVVMGHNEGVMRPTPPA